MNAVFQGPYLNHLPSQHEDVVPRYVRLVRVAKGREKTLLSSPALFTMSFQGFTGSRGAQLGRLSNQLKDRFDATKASFRTDLSSPENRRRAVLYERWFDHGFLRKFWTNMFEIAPGVWRSNHPTAKRFPALTARGIHTIISLRGSTTTPWALLEKEACTRHGIRLETVALKSQSAPNRRDLQALIGLFRSVEKPVLFHCKSGADRTGLASVMYLLVIENQPLEQARKMLSWRYAHLSWTKAGVLDMLLDDFATSARHDFEDWLGHDYDARALQKKFESKSR
ncbi:protein tyrosine/serine phosphatase [Octadecabacter antarcticus 307]|uniref:Protein tyrosine/serine phosphatase n=1 Tax=Octadecabacter antarcticus 307 TaxID=391626 RepID=M9RBX6_9RHOB|nr:protein tyrosine/serine phosphatase [Octadecabacter antarcticus 307]